jgi:nucleoid DNA-binding protein
MRASVGGRDELVLRVQQKMALATKKQAEMVLDAVVSALEETLLNNLPVDGFTLKLGSFGKFSVRHKSGVATDKTTPSFCLSLHWSPVAGHWPLLFHCTTKYDVRCRAAYPGSTFTSIVR